MVVFETDALVFVQGLRQANKCFKTATKHVWDNQTGRWLTFVDKQISLLVK
ncbi:hypothetical protein Scep_029360 [Stephania cephalantha]|uniref:Uncharacterized protein n=1 Tax=Stephania cephalantha TaxID=152367 RepID=A0AAP0HDG6_9MAGN